MRATMERLPLRLLVEPLRIPTLGILLLRRLLQQQRDLSQAVIRLPLPMQITVLLKRGLPLLNRQQHSRLQPQ